MTDIIFFFIFPEKKGQDNLYLWKKTDRVNDQPRIIYLTTFEYDINKVHDELNGDTMNARESEKMIIQVDENNTEKHFMDIEDYKRNRSVYHALYQARAVSLEVSMDKLVFRKAMYKNILKKTPRTSRYLTSILKKKSSFM
jgi:hypothetical protein